MSANSTSPSLPALQPTGSPHDMPGPDDFPLHLPDTKVGQSIVKSRLIAWRKNCMPYGLLQLGNQYTTDWNPHNDPTYVPSYNYLADAPRCAPPNHCAHFSRPERREVPGVFRQGTCKKVYVGILGDLDDTSSTPVAVKIYRPSRMSQQCWSVLQRDPPVFGEHLCVAMQSFKREFWAYRQMSSLQGTIIPHVYGFFEVQLPENERCVALVMEYIENIDRAEYVKSVGPANVQAIAAFADGLSLAGHAVQACGVSMQDLALRNILLPPTNPEYPVLVDFADVCAIEETGVYRLPEDVADLAVELGFDEEKVEDWKRNRHSLPTWELMFDLSVLKR